MKEFDDTNVNDDLEEILQNIKDNKLRQYMTIETGNKFSRMNFYFFKGIVFC